MASSKHLVIKCWNCGTWNFYCDDTECFCGVQCLEESLCSEGNIPCEVKEIDLKDIDIEKVLKEVL